MDFDDFLIHTLRLLHSNMALLHQLQSQIQVLVVDEFNDINPIQYEVIRLLCGPHCRLYAFGDSNQSIFAFRGSDPAIINSLQTSFADTAEITMNLNYRCSASIISAANLILGAESRVHLKASKAIGLPVRFIQPVDSSQEAKTIVTCIKKEIQSGRH